MRKIRIQHNGKFKGQANFNKTKYSMGTEVRFLPRGSTVQSHMGRDNCPLKEQAFLFSLVLKIIIHLVALGLSCSTRSFYLWHAGSKQGTLHWQCGVVATGPPGQSLQSSFLKPSVSYAKKLHNASLSLTLGRN